jgi:hypothetical protein
MELFILASVHVCVCIHVDGVLLAPKENTVIAFWPEILFLRKDEVASVLSILSAMP